MGRFFEHLPDGLLTKVMSWLPPESLERFKWVSKSWFVLIDSLMNSPASVAKHHENMESKRLSSRFIYCHSLEAMDYTDGQETFLLTLVSDSLDDFPSKISDDHKTCPSESIKHLVHGLYPRVVCHCNGIICLLNFDDIHVRDNIFFINPALMELKMVQSTHPGDLLTSGSRVVGFGYDSRANDYKVVVIKSLDEYGHEEPYIAEVYTLSTDSWKEIELNVELNIFLNVGYQVVYCKGVSYCLCWFEPHAILSFDISDEVFQMIDLPKDKKAPKVPPDFYSDETEEFTKIVVWKESLVYFLYSDRKNPILIHMWVLDNGDAHQGLYSWTKHLTIGPLMDIKWPLAFWDDDQLFMETIDGEIVLYNLTDQELDDRTLSFERFNGQNFLVFTKSLVSVLKNRGNDN